MVTIAVVLIWLIHSSSFYRRHFVFFSSQITRIPKTLYELTGEIDLSYNKIGALPRANVKNPAIKRINVSHNAVAVVPENIDKVISIAHLDLSYNQLVVST